MTEAERAAELADEIECYGLEWENGRVVQDIKQLMIVRALRAYAAPVSNDAELREAVALSICNSERGPNSKFHLKSFNDELAWSIGSDMYRHKAAAALSAIHASGWRIVPVDYTDRIVSEARRYASHYPIGSDGRNTFEMFADFVVRLAVAPTPSDAHSDNDPLRETF